MTINRYSLELKKGILERKEIFKDINLIFLDSTYSTIRGQ